jgi:hypothetical protein
MLSKKDLIRFYVTTFIISACLLAVAFDSGHGANEQEFSKISGIGIIASILVTVVFLGSFIMSFVLARKIIKATPRPKRFHVYAAYTVQWVYILLLVIAFIPRN